MKKLVYALCLTVPFLFNSCIPEDDTPPQTPQQNPFLNENFYFRGTLNSDPGNNSVYQNENIDFRSRDNYASVVSKAGHGGVNEQYLLITRQANSQLSGGVAFVKKFSAATNLCSDVEPMFAATDQNYGSRFKQTDGVVVFFIDDKGNEWASDRGLGVQDSTASFRITSHVPNTTDTFSKNITEATFECRLYDNSGRSLKLTNGMIRSRSVNCN